MKLNIPSSIQMEGKIQFRVLENGKEVFRHNQDNIFLNNFNDRPTLSLGNTMYLQLGTDNQTPPDPSQTGLVNFLVEKSIGKPPDIWAQDIANGYTSFTKTVLFSEGEAEGSISEVGIRSDGSWSGLYGWGDQTSKTITRALTEDSNGDPIVIEVASDQELEVTYEVRYTKSVPSTYTGSFTFDGTTVNYTVYPCNYWTVGINSAPSFWNQPANWGYHENSSNNNLYMESPHSLVLLYDIQNKSPTISELNPEVNDDTKVDLGSILDYSGATAHSGFSYDGVSETASIAIELSAQSSGIRNVSGFTIRSQSTYIRASLYYNTCAGFVVIFDTDLTIPELFKFNFEITMDPPQLV